MQWEVNFHQLRKTKEPSGMIVFSLTPKGPRKPKRLFAFLETFCEDAPRNQLCGSTHFVFFGPTDQMLWAFEVFR
jgi:hypothetical protein